MNTIFTIRLNPQLRQRLQDLALRSYRSRASVIRLLIVLAANNPNILLSDVGEIAEGSSISKAEHFQQNTSEVLG